MDPIANGDYPHTMRSIVGDRLPQFTPEQSKMLKGSYDFVGLNYYTANYAAYMNNSSAVNASYLTDSQANLSSKQTYNFGIFFILFLMMFLLTRVRTFAEI
ncbi:hypothetical protein HS088_TW15G01267 [Tripterygium wilfordii]|uniref:Uncharacterized protein n=1 Tax=Tripterygium wilfordii TaxID=458696 RepID=A0A7J7CNW9_TRIWF|nr:hypothetical protein HS088_TW15G01267 [Tripterygium wilfordii]